MLLEKIATREDCQADSSPRQPIGLEGVRNDTITKRTEEHSALKLLTGQPSTSARTTQSTAKVAVKSGALKAGGIEGIVVFLHQAHLVAVTTQISTPRGK